MNDSFLQFLSITKKSGNLLEGYNNSSLFIGDKTKPFVAIYLKENRLILINYEDENKTKVLFGSINSAMNAK